MIKVESVSKWYGHKHAVDNVSFEVNKGEVLGFIGPNGAGKSTTMRMITGFLPLSDGTITIGKHNIEDEPIKAKGLIGYLPESAPLYGHKTVYEFLKFAAEIRGFRGKEREEKVNNAIKRCFLEPVRHQSIDTLSKGYRHRTCFAQSILHDPEVLILDEPTDGLDPNQKREVRNLIKEMGKDKAIIISTHILEEVEAVADRVVLISDGKKVFDGAPAEFKGRSQDAGAVRLSVISSEKETVETALKQVESVKKVELRFENEEIATFMIHPESDEKRHDLFASISALIKYNSWNVEEFGYEKGRLDEVFWMMTESGKEVS